MGESATSPKPAPSAAAASEGFNPAEAERPDPALMTYYLLIAALTVVGFPFVAIAGWLKYRTLIYKFDDKGVSMAYGMFFRKEVYLTYRRIQDIHVTRNIFHRWLGLADVAVQTASGSAGAEMTIEGIRNPEALRDFLYARMRGVEDEGAGAADAAQPNGAGRGSALFNGASVESSGDGGAADSSHARHDAAPDDSGEAEALALLREIRDELRQLRERTAAGGRHSAAVTRDGPHDRANPGGGGA